MDERIQDLIRMRAFELSQDPNRTALSDLDNWLDAERMILGGLHEDEQSYDAASSAETGTMATTSDDIRDSQISGSTTTSTTSAGNLRRAS
jgi:hypothetical protein